MRFFAIFLGLLVLLSSPTNAQAYAPVGYWTTADNGERLIVEINSRCSFEATGGTAFGGDCTWQSSSRGGILWVYYSTVAGPAAVRWSVVWVDQTTITVNGDVFYRRQ